jgi:hypothetical protein
VRKHGRLGIVALSVAALASLLIVACGILFPTVLLDETPDAGGDTSVVDTSRPPPPDTAPPPAPTLCVGAQPPPPPAADTNSNIVPTVYAAIRTISFEDPDGGPPLGYNLDGVCTCEDSGPGDPVGPPSCNSPMKECDAPGGRDRAGNLLIGFLDELGYSESPEAYADGMIAAGDLGIVLVIGNYNGAANDTQVLVSSYVVTLHNADGGLAAPQWDGTDAWNVDPISAKFMQNGDGGYIYVPLTVSTLAYVSNWALVAELPELQANFGLGPVALSTIIFTATVTPMPEVGGYALLNGQMTARISTASAFTALSTLPDPFSDAGQSLCGDDSTFQVAKKLICENVDIMSNSLDDNAHPRQACDAVSLALAFQAYPAKLGAPFTTLPHSVGCDGSVNDCDRDF